ENLEHRELLPGQRGVAAVAVDLAAERIQPQTCDLSHGWPVVGAPAVECAEPEHELLEIERLRQVVVGAYAEPGGLVVKPVGSRQHEDRHPATGRDDACGDLVAGGSGNGSVEHGDVVGVEAQQLQSGVAVACDVCGDRFQAEAIADGFSHVWLVLDDQYAHARMLEGARIAGVSKNRYALATPRWEGWRRGLWKTSANDVPSDSDSQDTRRGAVRRGRGDRHRRPSVAGVLVLERHVTRRR